MRASTPIFVGQFLLADADYLSKSLPKIDVDSQLFSVQYESNEGEPTQISANLLPHARSLASSGFRDFFASRFHSEKNEDTLKITASLLKPVYELGERIVLNLTIYNYSFIDIENIYVRLIREIHFREGPEKDHVANIWSTLLPCSGGANERIGDRTRSEEVRIPLLLQSDLDLAPCVSNGLFLCFYKINLLFNLHNNQYSRSDVGESSRRMLEMKPLTITLPVPCVLPPTRPSLSELESGPSWLRHARYPVPRDLLLHEERVESREKSLTLACDSMVVGEAFVAPKQLQSWFP